MTLLLTVDADTAQPWWWASTFSASSAATARRARARREAARRDGTRAPSALHPPFPAAQRGRAPEELCRDRRPGGGRARAARPCCAARTRSMCSSTARRAWARPARRGWRWRRPSARRARPFARTRPLSRWTPPACALTSAPSPTRSSAASTIPSIRARARWGRAACRSPRKARSRARTAACCFLDEIGEMHPVQMNKLLKVLEDRVVRFDSAYYDPDGRGHARLYPRHLSKRPARRFSPHRRHHAQPRRHSPGPALALHGDLLPPAGARGTGTGRGKRRPTRRLLPVQGGCRC